jgi:hypothetical protein
MRGPEPLPPIKLTAVLGVPEGQPRLFGSLLDFVGLRRPSRPLGRSDARRTEFASREPAFPSSPKPMREIAGPIINSAPDMRDNRIFDLSMQLAERSFQIADLCNKMQQQSDELRLAIAEASDQRRLAIQAEGAAARSTAEQGALAKENDTLRRILRDVERVLLEHVQTGSRRHEEIMRMRERCGVKDSEIVSLSNRVRELATALEEKRTQVSKLMAMIQDERSEHVEAFSAVRQAVLLRRVAA